MKMKTLGRTDISVSEICLGTMTWGKQNTEAEGHQQMDYAVEQGINFFDTAEMYAVPPDASTYGKTEEIIGSWFKKTGKRNDIVLASKVAGGGRPWVRGGRGIDGPSVREAVEGSLRRLQTDRIDLYQIHWPRRGHYHFEGSWDYNPYLQDKESVLPNMLEVLQVMGELVREGKILHFGLSNESAWGTMQYLKLSMELGLPRVQTIQNEYNFLRRYYDMDLDWPSTRMSGSWPIHRWRRAPSPANTLAACCPRGRAALWPVPPIATTSTPSRRSAPISRWPKSTGSTSARWPSPSASPSHS